MCVYVYVCVCVRVRACACVRARRYLQLQTVVFTLTCQMLRKFNIPIGVYKNYDYNNDVTNVCHLCHIKDLSDEFQFLFL